MRIEVESCITQHLGAMPPASSAELIRAWLPGHAVVGDTAILRESVGRPYIGGYPASIQLPFTHHHHVNRTYVVLRDYHTHLHRRCSHATALPHLLTRTFHPSRRCCLPGRRIPLVPSATAAQLHDNTTNAEPLSTTAPHRTRQSSRPSTCRRRSLI
jgi:hypothetical protein